MLEGIRAKAGDAARVDHARGVRPSCSACSPRCSTCSEGTRQRIPRGSTRRPSSSAPSTLAARRRCRGRRRGRVAEHDRRGGLAVVAGAAGAPAGVAAGRRRDRHAGRAAGHERAPARPALARGARAGDPRHLVSRHTGRHGRRKPAVRRRLARRQAPLHLAAHGRAGADGVRPHPLARAREPGAALLGRGQHAAVPVRVRLELRPFRVRRPRRRSAGDHHRAGRSPCRWRSPTPRIDEADEVVQLYIHQRHGSASRPVRELKGFQRVTLARRGITHGPVPDRARTSGGTGTRLSATGSPTRSTFDVWVGGDSTAQLSTTFEVTDG